MLRCAKIFVPLFLTAALGLAGCATTSTDPRPPGRQACESFLIYVLCVADLDRNGHVDYMYFDDSRDIFMYDATMLARLDDVLPLHPCAIPMSPDTEEKSSALLYGQDRPLTERLALKAGLIKNYRQAQPQVDSCYAKLQEERGAANDAEEPFLVDDDWEDEVLP